MPSECEFQFDGGERPYIIGTSHLVAGRIILKTENVKYISSISVRLYGRSKVRFVRQRSTAPVVQREEFIDEYEQREKRKVLPAGTYSYGFNFALNSKCLTSLESEFGHIRYEVSLIIINQDKYSNVFKKPITVIKPNDLNARPEYQMPQSKESFRGVFVDFLNKICLSTNLHAYAPGQNINYALEACRMTYSVFDSYDIKFVKKMTFTANVRSNTFRKETTTILFRIFYPDSGSTHHLAYGLIPIPSTPPTSHYKNISVEYFIIAKTTLSTYIEAKVQLPIIIGTVPLRISLPDAQAQQMLITPRCYTMADSGEVTFIDVEVEKNRIDDFLPVYPMYKELLPISK